MSHSKLEDDAEKAIVVEDFRKVYDATVAADGISFSLPRGTVGALVGPNGAGKTTTIRMIMGILLFVGTGPLSAVPTRVLGDEDTSFHCGSPRIKVRGRSPTCSDSPPPHTAAAP